jgi:hypothetical protein
MGVTVFWGVTPCSLIQISKKKKGIIHEVDLLIGCNTVINLVSRNKRLYEVQQNNVNNISFHMTHTILD